jgi:hypothetical protein
LNILSIWGGRYLEREEIESLLREARIVRFCCLNEDGTIHTTPVWFKYENGKIVVLTPDRSRKARNVKRKKNVTILIDEEGPPTRGVIIYGTAELDYGDLIPTAISICEKYMPKERARSFGVESVRSGMDLVITVKPERMASFYF